MHDVKALLLLSLLMMSGGDDHHGHVPLMCYVLQQSHVPFQQNPRLSWSDGVVVVHGQQAVND